MKRYPPLAGAGGGQLRLVIEVDRYSHFLVEVILIDKIKEKEIKEAGFKVIRFSNTMVFKDIQNEIAEIEKNIEKFERPDMGKLAKVHPQPPPAGDIAIAHVYAKKHILHSTFSRAIHVYALFIVFPEAILLT